MAKVELICSSEEVDDGGEDVVVVVIVVGIGDVVDVLIGPNLLSSCLCKTTLRVFSRRLGRGRKNPFVFSMPKRLMMYITTTAFDFFMNMDILLKSLT